MRKEPPIRDPGDLDPTGELFGDLAERIADDPWTPAIDIFETRAHVIVRIEMAGVRGQDLRVNVSGDLLRIRGVRRVPPQDDVERLHQMEIAFGPFERSVRVGIPFDREGVSAHLEDGLLEVRLPKRSPRRVAVETE